MKTEFAIGNVHTCTIHKYTLRTKIFSMSVIAMDYGRAFHYLDLINKPPSNTVVWKREKHGLEKENRPDFVCEQMD